MLKQLNELVRAAKKSLLLSPITLMLIAWPPRWLSGRF